MGETTMPDENPTQDLRDQFAVAMAMGQKISVWAKKNGVPIRTYYDWRQTPEYKVTVRDVRRRAFDRAVGHFARNVTKAADRIALLATAADSQSSCKRPARSSENRLTSGSTSTLSYRWRTSNVDLTNVTARLHEL